MPQGGLLGNGVKLAYLVNSVSPLGTWLRIGQLMNITVPTLTYAKIDITTHGVAGLLRYMSGLGDVSDTVADVLLDWDNATAPEIAALLTHAGNKAILWLRVEIPADGTSTLYESVTFQVDVGAFAPDVPIKGAQTAKITFRFRGTTFAFVAPAASQIT